MGRRRAAPAKQNARSRANKGPVAGGDRSRASLSKAKLDALKKRVRRHRSGDRKASWELGVLASKSLGHTETAPAPQREIADLAERIGLIKQPAGGSSQARRDVSTLRQLMKFGRIATQRQAAALDKAELAWRGIVYWIGVENKNQRGKLYRKMVAGLTNSTKIRAYIETNLKKKPLPRFSGDCVEDFKKAQSHAESLAAVLNALCGSLDKHEGCGSARERRRLAEALKNTRERIRTTLRRTQT